MDNKELPQDIVDKIEIAIYELPNYRDPDDEKFCAKRCFKIASEYYEPKLAEKDAKIKEQAEQIEQMKVKFNLNYGGGFTEEDIKIASLEKQIEKLKGLLKDIDKSLYIGEDLKDNEIMGFYIQVVETIKETIKQHGI